MRGRIENQPVWGVEEIVNLRAQISHAPNDPLVHRRQQINYHAKDGGDYRDDNDDE